MLGRDERIKNLLMLRDFLKRRVEKLERELISLRRMIESLDEVLLEQTLTTADKLRGAEIRGEGKAEERVIYSEEGKPIGSLLLNRGRGEISFIPEEEASISARERPIKSFLFRKVEELEGKVEVEEDSKGMLKSLRVRLKDPRDIDKIANYVRWAVLRSLSQ